MKPLSIYIHIPFCERRCPYCDFESSVGGDVDAYILSLINDVKKGSIQAKNYTAKTIYFGGGTPSFIDATHIGAILATIRQNFNVAHDAEISIECNPNSLTEEKLKSYKKYGVNRISIGVQSFHNKTLGILGRVHNVSCAKTAIKLATKHFDNVSIDLIHSIPRGKLVLPSRYLKVVKHISAYCLTSDKYATFDDGKSIKQQKRIECKLEKYGIAKYEVSNFARSGFECKHNLAYWECGEWLGFGRGAKSHFNEPWTDADRIMLGLRLAKGIPAKLLSAKTSVVKNLIDMGFLEAHVDNIRCTWKGFLLLNQVLEKLI
ncbi:MAG: radical SAM family heme chaperone HemW [Christensenellaceae bacterium]|jgi:oxygen-independent coproporphyrinogen-3 oxidase|nr:radical SAM family heme chaperone HemW [Christensenellaceae bacterium]